MSIIPSDNKIVQLMIPKIGINVRGVNLFIIYVYRNKYKII